MPVYRYLTYSLVTNEILASLPFSDVTYNKVLNNPGSFSGTLPNYGIDQLSISTLNILHGLLVEKDGQIVWNGIIWSISTSVDGQKISVGAEGTWSLLADRVVRPTTTFDEGGDISRCFALAGITDPSADLYQDPVFIARQLIQYVQSEVLFGANSSIGIEAGTDLSGTLFEDFQFPDNNYGTLGGYVSELSQRWDNGFDYRVDAEWDRAGEVRKVFRAAHRLGQNNGDVYELGKNVSSLSVRSDGKSLYNFVIGQGDLGDNDNMAYFYGANTAGYPLIDRIATFPLTANINNPDVQLYWLTVARARSHSAPLEQFQISTPYIHSPDLDQMNPGDTVRLIADYGYRSIDQDLVVQTLSISPGNDGTSTGSLSLVPPELFREQ